MRLPLHLLFLLSTLPATVNAEPIVVTDGLIKLRLKEMARSDRLPHSDPKEITFTGVSFVEDLPESGASEAWPGEKFSEIALAQLSRLVEATNENEARDLLARGFLSSGLEAKESVKSLGLDISVHSGTPGKAVTTSPRELIAKLKGLGKVKLKVIGIQNLSTRFHVEANREGAEYSATWHCTWDDKPTPKLKPIKSL